jgi:glutamine synthetase
MQREELVFVGTCDLAGHVRGKGFPAADSERRLAKGVGLTHSNIMMSAFGPIHDTPFGTEGDLALVPDPTARVRVAFEGGAPEQFYLGDIVTLSGEPWDCCPRYFLRRALQALQEEAQLRVRAAFEQEFVYTGVEDRPSATYALDAWRRQGIFGEAFLAAIREAGAVPDSLLPEYGARQFEVTVAPAEGLRAADEAVIVREMARAVAHRLGHRAIFAPMMTPQGIGNGTHIHFSLTDANGAPVTYDARGRYGLSAVAERFAAGILHHQSALTALTAPSVASYDRLKPNRWAPTWANLGERDRGASLRVCPVFRTATEQPAQQFNLEYRVADATASPYMALGAIVFAGLDGIRNERQLPEGPKRGFWDMSEAEREAAGVRRLPGSLDEALAALVADVEAQAWLGPGLMEAYLRLKRGEIAAVQGLSAETICERYVDAY